MFDVHTGSKPGRPTVLLLLAGGVLVVALGLAWAQVRSARALGEAVALEGTPLVVRTPKGWVRDVDNPRLFGKLIHKEVWGREVWAAERTVEFHYNDFFRQFTRMFQVAAAYPAELARIGEWDGVQYVVARNTRGLPGQMAFRWVTTPGGSQIGVEYTPLAELSHGDLYLLDEICQAVRLDAPEPGRTAQALLARAGVSFPIGADWEILGPDDQRGPGLWVQSVEGNRPVWALGVHRRYLGRQRKPAELLEAEARTLRVVFEGPREQHREDGAYVGVLLNPDVLRQGSVVASLWVVAKSSTEAAVIHVLAEPPHAMRANEAAAELAGTLEFVAGFPG